MQCNVMHFKSGILLKHHLIKYRIIFVNWILIDIQKGLTSEKESKNTFAMRRRNIRCEVRIDAQAVVPCVFFPVTIRLWLRMVALIGTALPASCLLVIPTQAGARSQDGEAEEDDASLLWTKSLDLGRIQQAKAYISFANRQDISED